MSVILEHKVNDCVQQCGKTNLNCGLTDGRGLDKKAHMADALAAA